MAPTLGMFMLNWIGCLTAEADDYLRYELAPEASHPAFVRDICEFHGFNVSFGRSTPDHAEFFLQRADSKGINLSWMLCASPRAARRMVEQSFWRISAAHGPGPRKGFGPQKAPEDAPFPIPARDVSLPGDFAQIHYLRSGAHLYFARDLSFVSLGNDDEALLRDIALRIDKEIQARGPESFHESLDRVFLSREPDARKESESRHE